MEYVWCVVLLAVGLLAVIKGGDWFVDASSWIARAFRIPSFIIGATIVSLATTLPEIIVSCMAAAKGMNQMAIGNAVGSVTANSGLILSLALLFLPMEIRRRDYMVQCLMLIAAASVLLLGSSGGHLSTLATVALLVIFIGFMAYNLLNGKKIDQPSPDVPQEREPVDRRHLLAKVGLFLLGAVTIVVGSRVLVDSGSRLATLLGVPERVIAVTLVAIGTSLPELVTTLTAIRKKETGLSIGNIVGANIIDLTLILPVCGLISGAPLPITSTNLMLDLPFCLGCIVLALVPLLWRQRSSRVQGLLPLAAYVVYLVLSL